MMILHLRYIIEELPTQRDNTRLHPNAGPCPSIHSLDFIHDFRVRIARASSFDAVTETTRTRKIAQMMVASASRVRKVLPLPYA